MYKLRSLVLTAFLTCCMGGNAMAEGFAKSDWSARGLGLSGGMVARADDASAIAYNAAGITQVPGVSFMFGSTLTMPVNTMEFDNYDETYHAKETTWLGGHGYGTYQINEKVWLGLGVYSRFGSGVSYDENWLGRGQSFSTDLLTISAVPTIAYKFNDMFSASVGLEIMYMQMGQNTRTILPGAVSAPSTDPLSTKLSGDGVGFGVNLGLHAKFNEQWSAGIAYKSQITQNIDGEAKYRGSAAFKRAMNIPDKGNIHGTMQLPDSIAFAVMYKPLENLSFEAGAVFTRWSTYKHLNIYSDHPNPALDSNVDKNWRDGWNFNVSVEYEPIEWLALRAGYYHETDVTDDNYAEYSTVVNGRDCFSLGAGVKYENWTFDLSYTYIHVNDIDYRTGNVKGVLNGKAKDIHSDIIAFSVGYTF